VRTARLIDPDLIEASRILHGALVRVHPSFRFEERLAARLADAATGVTPGDDAWAPAPTPEPTPFPGRAEPARQLVAVAAPASPGAVIGRPRPVALPRFATVLEAGPARRALIGGAIASGVSLAGAALLARRWRRAVRHAERPGEPVAREGVA
jgi:hypothetical protein